MNPEIVKQQFLQAVEDQLQNNQPPETRQTLDRLKDLGYSESDAKLLIAQCIAVEFFHTVKDNQPYNNDRFINNLHHLPEFPQDE
ncbi:MAG TPA: hypothetical protein PKA00_20985 [Saprospiraceae bacterium]|nr:hypothetical protein [Saprospiraceae bacterium]HMQ85399.1 hypothetical protein [Saprospiraceae bacterium]